MSLSKNWITRHFKEYYFILNVIKRVLSLGILRKT